jgi:predicted AlkP superfamily pyrophosphatase or phosphodiesterase
MFSPKDSQIQLDQFVRSNGARLRKKWRLRLILILTLPIAMARWQLFGIDAGQPPPVVVISIDGLKPDYVLDADKYGLKIPYLRRFVKQGSYASGVAGVLPTVTYPSHTTLVTGVSPVKHGIFANKPFDPFGENLGGWYWYAQDIQVPTLWETASKAGMVTASVNWPVTVAGPITYNIVQYWRAGTPDDRKILKALSTPGLLMEAEAALGPYPDGIDESVEADSRRVPFIVYLLEKKKPQFQTCYFAGLDAVQHTHGPYTARVFAVLEAIDALVGQIWTAAERAGGGKAVVGVVSDHGFCRVEKELRLNAVFRNTGLIKLDNQGKVKSWRAFAWSPSGSAAIMLQDANDADARIKIRELLRSLASDPTSGVDEVFEGDQARSLEGFPGAAFIIGMKSGYKVDGNFEGPVSVSVSPGGMHGYLASNRAMDASFFLVGPGIPGSHDLGRIDMRDIAPTLAGRLGLSLPSAQGHNLIR